MGRQAQVALLRRRLEPARTESQQLQQGLEAAHWAGQGQAQRDAVEVHGQSAAPAAEVDAIGAAAAVAAACAAVAAAVQSLEEAGLTELMAVRRQLTASRADAGRLQAEVLGQAQLQA